MVQFSFVSLNIHRPAYLNVSVCCLKVFYLFIEVNQGKVPEMPQKCYCRCYLKFGKVYEMCKVSDIY
jgi:hypothetical protein